MFTKFEGEARAEKKRSRKKKIKVFQKVPKNAFYELFFQNFACSDEHFAETVSF